MIETGINQQNEQEIIEFKDNSKRANILITVFWVLTGLTLIGILTGYSELQMLKRAQIGEYISEEEANTSDMIQGIIGILQFGLYIASVVVFLNWFRRSYGNLHRLQIRYLRHNESMSVWAWFIPIVSFYRPIQIMIEIWNKIQYQIKKSDPSYIIKKGGFIIGLWWTLYILSNFIGRYVLKTAFKQDTIEQLIESSEAIIISDIMQIPEAFLVILIVTKISRMESRLAEGIKETDFNVN